MNKVFIRKIVPLIMAFVMVAGLTAGCGSSSGENIAAQTTQPSGSSVTDNTQGGQGQENDGTPKVSAGKKKVAFVYFAESAPFPDAANNALKYLENNGYKLGENLDFLKLTIEADPNKCADVLKKLTDFKPDVAIFDTIYTEDGIIKPFLNEKIPVVMMMDIDNPVYKFIDSPQKPNGLVTGIITLPSVIQTNSCKLLNEIAPINGKKAVFITNPASPVFNKADTEKALNANGIELKDFVEARTFEEYKQAALKYDKDPEVGWILHGTWTPDKGVTEEIFMQWHAKNIHKPNLAFWESNVAKGMLYGLVVDWPSLGTQTGEIALKILNGQKPGDIPIQEPKILNIILNQQRAKDLGITIPNSVIGSARRIYTDYSGTKYTEQK